MTKFFNNPTLIFSKPYFWSIFVGNFFFFKKSGSATYISMYGLYAIKRLKEKLIRQFKENYRKDKWKDGRKEGWILIYRTPPV